VQWLFLNSKFSCFHDIWLYLVTSPFTFVRGVTGHVTIGLAICQFLLVVLWNQTSISNYFGDIQRWMWCNG